MKKLYVLCITLCVGLSTTAAFARGGMGGAQGMGSSHMSMMGGAFGTTTAAPGTNSSGTALSSDCVGRPMLDTKPAIAPEDAKIDKMIIRSAGDVDASGLGRCH